ncbi:MAG: cyclic nucleotide-binding domain-containing protein [Deltaproteobacteria bacterium]|nr:cyclic nucleotide-binding domain-containing protein [Deltaproteobacteria bacterium]
MLSVKGVPDELEDIYTACKDISKEIYDFVAEDARTERLAADTDLYESAPSRAVVYILEGFFKLDSGDKALRLYSESDFVIPEDNFAGLTLRSDFTSDVAFFDRDDLQARLREDAAMLEKWFLLRERESKLHLAICALHVSAEIEAAFELKEYHQGDIIVNEGDPPLEIFEMMTGNATVLLGDKEIGSIGSQEIFGEIGFLTDSVRTATVVAATRCFVRIVKKDDFFSLVESNPHLGVSISRTLAKRIVELNDRLVSVP